ncbi:MAG: Smr/MutS family protein [Hydrogenophilaceae bacterium]|nr:Smr/MutS family protein [Hydrogenophilaceae bacterium]
MPEPPFRPEDLYLFRQEVSDAVALPPHNRKEHYRPRIKPLPLQRLRDEKQVLRDSLSDPWEILDQGETGEELFFCRPGVTTAVLRKLKRGGWVIAAELDLHGLRSDEARITLASFLLHCVHNDLRCVRIIHGKGLRSKNREPVLKHKLRHWLMQREDVLAFCQARPADGGSGAVIVLLKSSTRVHHP